ncbi:MAG: leucine-rich repeat domain-containing protein [Holosporales bacterium]|jgi:hypothetical protein|nr:leucine-rich repeat domain-containing protein [Holosporales bacterium]
MKKQKILSAVSALALGMLSIFSETNAMSSNEGRFEEEEEALIGSPWFLELPVNGFLALRSATAHAGVFEPSPTIVDRAFVLYLQGTDVELRSFVIPAHVETLEQRCFWNYQHRSPFFVAFAANPQLKSMGEGVFAESGLFHITIPAGIGEVSAACFVDCPLSSITFAAGSRITRINPDAFEGSNLQFFFVVSSVEEIGVQSFYSCQSLRCVMFGEGCQLQVIHERTFSYCSALQSITIPASVQELREKCFETCSSLGSVLFESGSQLSAIGRKAFNHSAVQAIVIPASVEILGDGCFANCSHLSSVTFEDGSQLVKVGAKAFCRSALQGFTVPASVTILGERCFADCTDLSRVIFAQKFRPQEIGKDTVAGSPQVRLIVKTGASTGRNWPVDKFNQGLRRAPSS